MLRNLEYVVRGKEAHSFPESSRLLLMVFVLPERVTLH